jgi:PAS domain S-box-containing protein
MNPTQNSTARSAVDAHSQGKPSLLVVDDEPVNIQVLFQAFRDDHIVRFATGGLQALEMCAAAPPDLILLDVEMPDLGGLEVCRRLKAMPATAHNDAAEIAEGLDAGAVDFITKPVNRLVVRARVRTHVTLRQQAERRRAAERMQQMVEGAPNAMILVDSQGLVVLANEQAEQLFGYPREELMGTTIDRLVPPGVRDRHPKLRADYAAAPTQRAMGHGRELFGQTRDGRQVPIEIGLSSLSTEQGSLVLASIIDITERKRTEAAMQRLNDSLQAQILETDRALQRLHETQGQLVQAEKMASLGNLVAGIAHEINTPVGIGVTAASHLRQEVKSMREAMTAGTLSKSMFEKFLSGFDQAGEILEANLFRAAELIRSFKQVAVDQTSEEKRRIRLKAYIEEVLVSLRPRLKNTPHQIQLECPEDLEILTSPGALAQILTNLVVNALVHAFEPQRSGLMRILVAKTETGVRLEFEDDGRGIAPENLSKIFDPFFTTRRGQGGTGLGLHIVFNLVSQTLGGTIVAESPSGKGARFTMTF